MQYKTSVTNSWFPARPAYSLVEVVVVIGITSILIGLMLPAIQMSREAARQRQCLNHCRQFAIANQNYVTTHQNFPTFWKNAAWGSPAYSADRGLFVVLLPYLELEGLYNEFDLAIYANGPGNLSVRRKLPTIYQCPTGQGVAELNSVAERFDGDAIAGNQSWTMDYAGAAGLNDNVRIPAHPKSNLGAAGGRLSTIRDGLSNTILGWESSGDRLYKTVQQVAGQPTAVLVANDYNEMAPMTFCVGREGGVHCSAKRASALAYVYGWVGLGTGTVNGWTLDGRPGSPMIEGRRCINRTNIVNDPFSHHPAGVNVWMADGSTRFVSEDMDARVFALAVVIADGEINPF